MITKEQKARLIVFSTVSLALLIALLGLLIVPAFRDRGYPYTINIKGASVNGLSVGSAVKYQGVDVGKVKSIRVNPHDLDSILVEARIDRGFPVKKDMAATLTYAGITGLKFIEFSGGSESSPDLPVGGEIQMARGLGERAEDIVTNIDGAVKSINKLLSADNQRKITEFLTATNQSAEVVSRVLKGKEENLSGAIVNIEKAALDFGAVTENLRKITADLGGLTGTLDTRAAAILDNLNKRFSGEEMGKVLNNLESFIADASTSLKTIENVLLIQQSDLKRTVESFSFAVDNLSRLSRSLVEDPTLLLRGKKDKK
jgi:phospholipid/cholesterol/gamma-HCH transport system substrate-binding protein